MGRSHGRGKALRAVLALLALLGLGAGAAALPGLTSLPPVQPAAPVHPAPWPSDKPLPQLRRVFVIVMENRSPADLVGPLGAPYLRRLMRHYAAAGDDWAVAHPSLPNYLALTAGTTFGRRTDCSACYVGGPNLAGRLQAAGISWGAYLEGLPRRGFLGAVFWPGLYVGKHDPFRYFDAVRRSPTLRRHLLPLSDLWPALAHGRAPRLVWITPNLCDDMHSCPTLVGDLWLRQVVPRILASSAWRNAGVLFVTFDEGTGAGRGPGTGAGGKVPLVAISPNSRPGYVDRAPTTHYTLLATLTDLLGVPCLGQACGLHPLSALFGRPRHRPEGAARRPSRRPPLRQTWGRMLRAGNSAPRKGRPKAAGSVPPDPHRPPRPERRGASPAA